MAGIWIMRIGHRPERDKRVTTHVALSSRALGAKGIFVDTEDPVLEENIRSVVDRFGGGDSFCAGLIFALSGDEFNAPDKAIRFAVAASCLKHSVKGDYNYTTKDEVVSLMNGSGSGRVKR